ncbi:PREDICTED: polygalacturonase inhibitor-like [Nelumbo nucifera]|uniref:Uncharacterized protein n=2 Tax=Nelumbo nucifera TaxID=4432 RepID=A0A822ZFN5_NELNU|nr:PREDICTED: polygalacturonase inhibitor-like [Nelumbo nucifera]DAD42249.1 TPA_asm: hypothetical protein HUJ06_000479 [Nelumbo nucifera]
MLSGKIPKSFGHLNCEELYLSSNKLTGDASILLRENATMTSMILSWNRLDYDLSKIKFAKNLAFLDLSHNRIRRSIPKQITELDNLQLGYNLLCGMIPFGGKVQQLGARSFVHNLCLRGAPLPDCN